MAVLAHPSRNISVLPSQADILFIDAAYTESIHNTQMSSVALKVRQKSDFYLTSLSCVILSSGLLTKLNPTMFLHPLSLSCILSWHKYFAPLLPKCVFTTDPYAEAAQETVSNCHCFELKTYFSS